MCCRDSFKSDWEIKQNYIKVRSGLKLSSVPVGCGSGFEETFCLVVGGHRTCNTCNTVIPCARQHSNFKFYVFERPDDDFLKIETCSLFIG
jgi:hypothetical protein